MGRSISEYIKSTRSLSRPGDCRPSHATNSVHITSGLPYLAMMRRKAASVTLAMGARPYMGSLSCFQKPVIIEYDADRRFMRIWRMDNWYLLYPYKPSIRILNWNQYYPPKPLICQSICLILGT